MNSVSDPLLCMDKSVTGLEDDEGVTDDEGKISFIHIYTFFSSMLLRFVLAIIILPPVMAGIAVLRSNRLLLNQPV
ncbi:uncharacterized protein YALI1_C04126g [Yarrowia lipolytica]|uniref:Uncharacterized protein n=1 Tax=Yarrowia lipolytica TaxID=4952 RepID=A0A1D8N9F5_YARLL|nr:hypothetical protein YALI1_C04126g [Yarrowia lipolytica]